MANLVQTGLALAPALVPLGAAAVPVIAGLTNQLGFAALAAGATVLAFHGIGDALNALNAYQLQPTQANFLKMQKTMDALGPSGREFVQQLQALRPELQQLQAAAEAGLLPGVGHAIDDLQSRLPEVERLITTITGTLGKLTEEGARSLAGPEWDGFFRMLETEAKPTLVGMAHTAGDLALGFAKIWEAFQPLDRDFTKGLERDAQAFKNWADGLDRTQGFQDFLDYVRTNGPKALDALSAIGGAIVQIIEAAAPIGSAVLPVITDLAKLVGDIANTPVIGSGLISLAAAIGAYGRALALLKVVGLRGDGQGIIAQTLNVRSLPASLTAVKTATAATRELAVAEQEAAAAHARYIGALQASSLKMELIPGAKASTSMVAATDELNAANGRVVTASKAAEEAERTKTGTMRDGFGTVVKAGALVGAFAAANSGLADQMGLTNTSTLAMIGMLGGPWGAAVGGATGLTIDFFHANDDLDRAIRQLNADLGQTTGYQKLEQDLAAVDKQASATHSKLQLIDNVVKAIPVVGSYISALKTHGAISSHDAADQAATDADMRALNASAELAAQLGAPTIIGKLDLFGTKLRFLSTSSDDLAAASDRAQPALEALGYSARDLGKLDPSGVKNLASAVKAYLAAQDAVPARSAAVGTSLAALDDEFKTTADRATGLQNALDSLFGTGLDASAANDAWIQSLQALRKQIASTKGAIIGNSNAALANRDAIRTSVKSLEDRVVADAKVSQSGRRAAEQLLKGRDAIIAQAVAAGASKRDIQRYLAQLNLTPKSLATIITTPGLLNATQQVRGLGKLYGLTPKQVSTLFRQLEMGASQNQIKALLHQYGLTPKQIATLVKVAGTPDAQRQLELIQARLAALHDKTIRINIEQHQSSYLANRKASAAGNLFYAGGDIADGHMPELAGPGTTRIWREPETGGEAYIPLADDWRRGRAVDIWEQTGAALGLSFARFAAGGTASSTGKRKHKPDVLTLAELHSAEGAFHLPPDSTPAEVRKEFHDFAVTIRRDGGTVTAAFRKLEGNAIDVAHEFARTSKEIDDERQQRQKLVAAEQQLASTVAGGLTHDPFTANSTPVTLPGGFSWLSAADQAAYLKANGGGPQSLGDQIFSTLHGDTANARKFTKLEKELKGRGLHGDALSAAESEGDPAVLQALASMSATRLRQYQHDFDLRAHAVNSASRLAGTQRYGAQLDQLKGELTNSLKVQQHLENELKGLRDDVKHAVPEAGTRFGEVLIRGLGHALRKAGR